MVDARRLRRGLDFLVGRVRLREAEVLAHTRVEEIRLLRDDADEIGERLEAQVANVDAADRHAPRGDVVQPRGQIAERRLAGAGLADDRRRRPGGHHERHVLERPGGAAVAEGHVVVRDVARLGDRERVGLLVDVDRLVEVLEDAVEERERRLDVETDAEERPDREE